MAGLRSFARAGVITAYWPSRPAISRPAGAWVRSSIARNLAAFFGFLFVSKCNPSGALRLQAEPHTVSVLFIFIFIRQKRQHSMKSENEQQLRKKEMKNNT